ncbi:MAG: chemotaxis protein CheA [Desulfobulbaceae bacterium]|nr:chemotaxis protein CheA [Desulfobulbaceae bacterium]HIJ91212.1 chemotaxis protein CheA [Deltaproteobacteria bacterium]
MRSEMDIRALQGFLDESNDSLLGIESSFIELENDPANLEIINKIFRPVHSLKGNSGFFGLTNINKFAHRLENLLDTIRKGDLLVTRKIIDVLLHGTDYLQKMLDRAADDPNDIALRPDEEEFLAKVEECRPEEKVGNVQSLLNLQQLLDEAMDLGLKIQGNALLANLFAQMEKANHELTQFIKESKSAESKAVFAPGATYLLAGEDFTDRLKPLAQVLESLKNKKAIQGDLIKEFEKALQEISTNSQGRADDFLEHLDNIMGMANFIDDELMASSDEFYQSISDSMQSMLAHFEVRIAAADGQGERLGEILVEQALISSQDLASALDKQKKVGEILLEEGKIAAKDLENALEIQNQRAIKGQGQAGRKEQEAGKTIRIDQYQLDNFANYVGELFIALDSFNYLRKQMFVAGVADGIISKFTSTTQSLDELVEQLQESVMGIRKVPIKNLLQRLPRVIRELSGSLGKDIDFKMQGEDTVIDKDLLEKIENPLVHLLRNSVDHGIELPEIRKANGKSEKGILEIKASVDENYVYLVINDDGAGIDPQKMKNVAVKKGFMSEAEVAELSDKELINLVFKPGFSSAEKVSDVSGRGVGMDVVLSGLKECGGTIQVDSTVNRGTNIKITIPLTKTLVAKDAMIVEAAGRVYAIPSDSITASIKAEKGGWTQLYTEENCLNYDGSVMQVLDIGTFFYPNLVAAEVPEEQKQVIIVCREQKLALLVDQVVNHQKIVVKDFNGGYEKLNNIKGVSGYTILGNEEVVLILDIQKITAAMA